MEAIKKKMQSMKLEKDLAMDRADTCEQQAKDANLRAEKVGLNHFLILKSNLQKLLSFCQFQTNHKVNWISIDW